MKPDRIQFAPAQPGWDLVGQKIDKTYVLDSFLAMAAFTMFVKALAEAHARSAALDFHITGTDVMVEISRQDGKELTKAEATLADAIDAVHELLDVAPSSEEE